MSRSGGTRIHVDSQGRQRGGGTAPPALVGPLPVRQQCRAAALLRLHAHPLPARDPSAARRDAAWLQPDAPRRRGRHAMERPRRGAQLHRRLPRANPRCGPDAITGPTDEPPDQSADYAAGEPPGNQLDPCWQDGNGDNCWNWFLPDHQRRGAGEPAIIAGITRAVMANTAQWTIDPDRVYVAGMSAGGAMAVILGATYPDLYSAVAAHSALEYQAATTIPGAFQALLQGGPNPAGQGQKAFEAMGGHARLMPVLVVHGSNDVRVNPVNGDQVIQQWLHTNRLATGGAFTADFATPDTNTPSPKPHPAVTPTASAPGPTTTARSSSSTGPSTAWATPGPAATGWGPSPIHEDPTPPGPCTPSSPGPASGNRFKLRPCCLRGGVDACGPGRSGPAADSCLADILAGVP